MGNSVQFEPRGIGCDCADRADVAAHAFYLRQDRSRAAGQGARQGQDGLDVVRDEIDAIVVATGAPREPSRPPWVVLSARVVKARSRVAAA
jgi:hypothetical protein